ncbi:MAG TPA: hypothetical protein VF177_11445 [Anaerolineae bacterium]
MLTLSVLFFAILLVACEPAQQPEEIEVGEEVVIEEEEFDEKVNDPKAEALFETAAEVLGGLKTAFEHYEQSSEEAWQ